jgi:hypothetical protein
MKSVITIGSLIIMVALCRLWIEFDQFLLPQQLLLPAFMTILVVMMSIYFYIVKPKNAQRFALYLSFVVCLVAIALSLLQHVVLQHNFNVFWKKSLIIWAISLAVPNIIGFVYSKINCNKNRVAITTIS